MKQVFIMHYEALLMRFQGVCASSKALPEFHYVYPFLTSLLFNWALVIYIL